MFIPCLHALEPNVGTSLSIMYVIILQHIDFVLHFQIVQVYF